MLMVIMIINNNSTSFSIYQSVYKPHQQNVYYQVYIISENNIIVLSVVIFAKIKFHFAVVFFILIEYLLPACTLRLKQYRIPNYIFNKINNELYKYKNVMIITKYLYLCLIILFKDISGNF